MKKTLTALIADDKALARDTLKYILQDMDITRFHETANGRDAADLHRRYKPDITFLDISMPELNGIECLEFIKSFDPDAFIVLVSGHNDAKTVRKGIQRGADGYVVKPFSAEKIVAMVDKYKSTQQ